MFVLLSSTPDDSSTRLVLFLLEEKFSVLLDIGVVFHWRYMSRDAAFLIQHADRRLNGIFYVFHTPVARVPARRHNRAEDTIVSSRRILSTDESFVYSFELQRRLLLAVRHLSSADIVDAGANRKLFMCGAGNCTLIRTIE